MPAPSPSESVSNLGEDKSGRRKDFSGRLKKKKKKVTGKRRKPYRETELLLCHWPHQPHSPHSVGREKALCHFSVLFLQEWNKHR